MTVGIPLMRAQDVSVTFGGVRAVDGAAVTAEAGQVTGLIGPNGAGKTTLFNAVSGLVHVQSGTVVFDGVDVTRWSAHRRARAGMARTFQRPQLLGALSVRDNVLAGWEASAGWAALAPSRAAAGRRQVDEAVELMGLGDVADTAVSALPSGRKRLVELARAAAVKPRLLLLDEPGSGLDPEETADLGRRLRILAEGGAGLLLVEHDMSLVMEVCDRVVVMELGRMIAEGPPEQVREDPAVIAAYLGTAA